MAPHLDTLIAKLLTLLQQGKKIVQVRSQHLVMLLLLLFRWLCFGAICYQALGSKEV
jgi:hypothetical protein